MQMAHVKVGGCRPKHLLLAQIFPSLLWRGGGAAGGVVGGA